MRFKVREVIVVVCAVLGAVVGGIITSSAPPDYRSTSSVIVSVNEVGRIDELTQMSSYVDQQISNYSNLAKKPVVQDLVAQQLQVDTASDALAAQITTSVPMNSTIIDITASALNGGEAAQLANATADALARAVEDLSPKNQDDQPLVSVTQVATALPAPQNSAPSVLTGLVVGLLAGLVIGVVLNLLIVGGNRPLKL